MRAILLAALLAMAAGCAGDDKPPPVPTSPTTSPTPEPTPPTNATPTPEPTPPTPTPTPEPELAPRAIADQRFDFNTEGDPTGQSARTRPTERVPAEYRTLVINVTLERASPAPAPLPVSGSVSAPRVRVAGPDGTEALVVDEEGAARSVSVPAIEGVWNVAYEGAGTMRATVKITAYP